MVLSQIQEWEIITSDKKILKTVEGLTLEFVQEPPSQKKKSEVVRHHRKWWKKSINLLVKV